MFIRQQELEKKYGGGGGGGVHWFRNGWCLSACGIGVFSTAFKDVIVSPVQEEIGSSFHQRGTERVKVLESDFLPCCDGTQRRHSLSIIKIVNN